MLLDVVLKTCINNLYKNYLLVLEDGMELHHSIEVRGSRIEYVVYCDWCAGHGFESDANGDIVDCDKCQGTCVKFRHVMESDDVLV